MNNIGKIHYIERVPGLKHYVQGDSFSKGEYMSEDESKFWVHVIGGKDFEVGREDILKFFPDRKRITDALLDWFKDKNANIFQK